MEWFDSILFVLSIRGIFDSVTSRDHAMKFWKLIRSKGWSFTIKIPFHAKVLDPDCFSKRNLMKFSNVRRVNLQIDQFGSRLARIIGRSCVRHSIDAWFRVIPRKEGSEFSSKIDGNDLEKEFCTVISRTTPFRKPVYLGPYVFRAYHWYRLKPLATCIDESDPLLPSLSHSYRIFLSSTMPTRSKFRNNFINRNFRF